LFEWEIISLLWIVISVIIIHSSAPKDACFSGFVVFQITCKFYSKLIVQKETKMFVLASAKARFFLRSSHKIKSKLMTPLNDAVCRRSSSFLDLAMADLGSLSLALTHAFNKFYKLFTSW